MHEFEFSRHFHHPSCLMRLTQTITDLAFGSCIASLAFSSTSVFICQFSIKSLSHTVKFGLKCTSIITPVISRRNFRGLQLFQKVACPISFSKVKFFKGWSSKLILISVPVGTQAKYQIKQNRCFYLVKLLVGLGN